MSTTYNLPMYFERVSFYLFNDMLFKSSPNNCLGGWFYRLKNMKEFFSHFFYTGTQCVLLPKLNCLTWNKWKRTTNACFVVKKKTFFMLTCHHTNQKKSFTSISWKIQPERLSSYRLIKSHIACKNYKW